jgi:hypothetical protein
VVTVTKGGARLEDAFVNVEDLTHGTTSAAYTNSSGEVMFGDCDIEVNITAMKSGARGYLHRTIQCGPCPECGTDADCPDDKLCSGGQCILVPCTCGIVESHQCTRYECCADTDCPEGQMCKNHACVQKPVVPPGGGGAYNRSNVTCNTSDQCRPEQFCKDGQCRNVTGECGQAVNHAWVRYECGPEPECPVCPRKNSCVSRKCVPDIGIAAPDTGFVGERVNVTVTEGTGLCRNCDVKWASPQGRTGTGKTDANGKLVISLDEKGTYKFTVVKDPRKIASVNALSRPGLFEGQLPTVILSEAVAPAFWLGVLLLIIIGLVLYQRRRGSGKVAR